MALAFSGRAVLCYEENLSFVCVRLCDGFSLEQPEATAIQLHTQPCMCFSVQIPR